MERRDALRLIGSAAAIPVFSGLGAERLWAIAESTHLRAAGAAGTALDAHQLETVAAIAEHILPRTDTPGARDAGVPEFVDLLLAEWYDETERGNFIAGLAAIDTSSRAAGAESFAALAAPDQLLLLQALDSATTRPPAPDPAASATPEPTPPAPGSAEATYANLKRLTLYGYFTSKPVMTTVLRTNIWPGRYDGCVPA
jgi:gluconate 2-dehydrogenase gamma chain